LILTAAYTGLRAGELGALKVARLNLLRGTVDVVESLSEVRGQVTTGPTKTGARRSVALPRFLVRELEEHLAAYPSTGYVFTSAEGGPVRHRNFYRRHFKPAVAAARARAVKDEREGDPRAPRPLDYQTDLRPLRPPLAEPRRDADGRTR
jgi:integrase